MASSLRWSWWLVSAVVVLASGALATPTIRRCPDEFTVNISASTYTQAVTPTWNLENALDTASDVNALVDDIKAAGFKSIRIPIDYTNHYTSGSPSWTIDEKWLQRLSRVVEVVTSKGLYAIPSVHHDSIEWTDVTEPEIDINSLEDKFYKTWRQIGFLLTCSSNLVAFEALSEPPATTAEHDALISELNNQFVTALAATGGYNSLRFVILLGPRTDGKWFVPPRYIVNPWAVQYRHYQNDVA